MADGKKLGGEDSKRGAGRRGRDPSTALRAVPLPVPGRNLRVQTGKHRKVQVARTGERKLFGVAAQKLFLEWFAATCNLSWSAEMAGFNYKTVLRHRMNDARFREGWERAVAQGYARLEAQQLETKKREVPIGIEGDWDAPEMDPIDPQLALAILRERKREVKHPEMVRRQGRRPRVASNAEVKAALEKRLKAFYLRERARLGREAGHEEEADLTRHSRESGNPSSASSSLDQPSLDSRFRGNDEVTGGNDERGGPGEDLQ